MKKISRLKIVIFGLVFVSIVGCGKQEEVYDPVEVTSEVDDNVEAEVESGVAEDLDESVVETVEDTTEEITILMAGDMLLHDRVEEACLKEDGSYNYEAIFENVKAEIEGADIAIANQEVIIGGQELGVKGYPAFNAPYEFADALVDAGFDIVCHGTNHALDKGGKGIKNCLNNWQEKYPQIPILGINLSQEAQEQIYIWESPNGTRIAFLNYTYGTNGIALPDDMQYAVDYLSEDKIVSDIRQAEEEADFTVVCPHWGTEYRLEPDSSQKKWAKLMIKNGADLIIGTHPHVIEPIETVTDEETGNTGLVYYSIGNFVNWTSGTGEGVSNRMVGGLAEVKLECEDGKVHIADSSVIPVVSHVTSEKNGVTVYKLEDYIEELAGKNEIISQAPDFSLEYCRRLVEEVFGNNR